MQKRFAADIALVLTSLIWGLSFTAQRAGMEYIGPFTFNVIRSLLGGISLLPLIWIVKFINPDNRTIEEKVNQHKNLAKGGLVCGIALFTAISIQQFCMQFVPAGKAGFISALYLIFVPLISIVNGKRLGKNVIISILIAMAGLYLLCYKSDVLFDIYDGILLISAFFYAVHILAIDYFSQNTNAVKLSCIQFFVVCIFSVPLMFCFENPSITDVSACRVPLFYAGVLTCGVAYTLQIFGQKYTPPVIASLILSMESIFAVLGGVLILSETLTARESIGCFLMIIAVILSKIKSSKSRRLLHQGLPAAVSLKTHSKTR